MSNINFPNMKKNICKKSYLKNLESGEPGEIPEKA